MAVRDRDIQPSANVEDAELARRAATGDALAFEELYRRHATAAWGVAQAAAANRHDAADAVSEAFTRMFSALASGRLAPDVPFRPYLLVTTRNVAIDQHRRAGRTGSLATSAVIDLPALTAGPGERAVERADHAFVGEAFRSLPERYRTVLWLTEVEGMSAREVGARLGLTANNAAQLAHRARAGLRERYLQAHLRHEPPPECERTVALLGSYVAGRLSPRAVAATDQHLAGCEDCRTRLAQLTDVGTSLRAIALPIPAGLGAAALARYHVTFPAAAPPPTAGVVRRLIAGPERAMRSLTVTTGALLTAGVITAGLMSSGGGPAPIRGSRSLGNEAQPPPPTVRTFPIAPAAEVTPAIPDVGAMALPTEPMIGAPSGTTGSSAATAPPSDGSAPAPGPVPSPPAVPPSPASSAVSPSPSSQPVVGVAAGANLGVLTTSGSLGVGGGCTGLSVNGSSSCAPPAPTQAGVTVSATTPIGKVGNASAPASTSTTTAAPLALPKL